MAFEGTDLALVELGSSLQRYISTISASTTPRTARDGQIAEGVRRLAALIGLPSSDGEIDVGSEVQGEDMIILIENENEVRIPRPELQMRIIWSFQTMQMIS